RAAGIRCRIVFRETAFEAKDTDTFALRVEALEDWNQLFAACAGEAVPERITYLWNLDTQIDGDGTIGTDPLLHLVQSLDSTWPTIKLRIDSVTGGAEMVAPGPGR